MRLIFIYLIFINSIFASILYENNNFKPNNAILSSNDAFIINSDSNTNEVYLDINVANKVYLYKDRINLILNGQNINEKIEFPKSEKVKGEERIYGNFKLVLPNYLFDKKENILDFFYQGCTDDGICYQPLSKKYEIIKNEDALKINTYQKNKKISEENLVTKILANENFIKVLIAFFGYGLLLSLTPCVLPMVPILSSIIIAKTNGKKSKIYNFYLSFIYVFFMSIAYALAGILAAYLGFSVQGILQKPVVLIIFACIFILLALAMFGVFNFQVSSKFQSFLEEKIKKTNGILGIALMGFLSALIVGPCVAAPLSGALIYIANSKDIILGGSALFIMSFGMGIPLLLVGFGIGFLKAGFWMEKIKVLFGFIMLLMAVWILSRILEENYILILYGVIGVFFAVYFGIFESKNKFLKAILILILSYSINIFLDGVNYKNLEKTQKEIKKEKLNFKYIENLKDLREEINQNKKLLVYFTASWCENCKLLEDNTFKNKDVITKLQDYKLIKIDITDSNKDKDEIIKEYKVFGPPVMIIFEDQKITEKIVGYIDFENFLVKLN